MKTNPYPSLKVVFHVGRWMVQPHVNKLSTRGRRVTLEPKVMEVLVCLASHADEVVSRDQLMKAVWPDTFVTQDSLKRCVSVLRRALDDDAQHPHIIETIRKRGYRIVAPVQPHFPGQSVVSMESNADSVPAEDYQSLLSYFVMIGSLLGLDIRSGERRDGTRISLPGVQ
jgi:DNA-binding winged helix-turn-helix (wHTH) protein